MEKSKSEVKHALINRIQVKRAELEKLEVQLKDLWDLQSRDYIAKYGTVHAL